MKEESMKKIILFTCLLILLNLALLTSTSQLLFANTLYPCLAWAGCQYGSSAICSLDIPCDVSPWCFAQSQYNGGCIVIGWCQSTGWIGADHDACVLGGEPVW